MLINVGITIDEKWPVFSLTEPSQDCENFNIEISEELYKEYLWYMYKYHEMQLRLQVFYEQCQRRDAGTPENPIRPHMQQDISSIHGAS